MDVSQFINDGWIDFKDLSKVSDERLVELKEWANKEVVQWYKMIETISNEQYTRKGGHKDCVLRK